MGSAAGAAVRAAPFGCAVAAGAGRPLPPGTWAVLSFQDENDNGKLDRNVLGIPKERYAFSRDARGRFGPPSFEDAAFVLRDEKAVSHIKLR